MSLKTKITNKLFYKRWLYKIVVTCGGISHLHRKGIGYILSVEKMPVLSGWQSTINNTIFNNKRQLVEIGSYLEVCLKDKKYQIRVESSNLALFTNDADLVDLVLKGLEKHVTELHKPSSLEHATFLESNKSKVLCDELPHEKYRYKIYFKNGNAPSAEARESFLKWSSKFDDGRIYLPLGTRKILDGSTYPYFYGQYFYAKDNKMASMALMIMGDYMGKTEEYILKSEVN